MAVHVTEHARKVREYSQMDKLLMPVPGLHNVEKSEASVHFLANQEVRARQQYDSTTRDIQASIKYCKS